MADVSKDILYLDPRCSKPPFVLSRAQYVECSRKATYAFSVVIAVVTLLLILIMYLFSQYERHIPLVALAGGGVSFVYFCLGSASAQRAGLEWDGYQLERQRLLDQGMSESDAMKEVFRSYDKHQLAPMSDMLSLFLLL